MKAPLRRRGGTGRGRGEMAGALPLGSGEARMYRGLNPGAIGITLPFVDTVQLAAKHGLGGIDLSPALLFEASSAERRAAKQALMETGLLAGGYALPVHFRGSGELFRRDLERLPEVAATAAEFGCTRCVTCILPYHDELTFPENFELHRERLGECARVLEANGARLGLEFVGTGTMREGHPYDFIHDMKGVLELCKVIDAPHVGILLDSFHWHTSGGTVEQLEAQLSPEQIVYVQISDAPADVPREEQRDDRRLLPGATGVIDLAGFLDVLRAKGYDGPVTAAPSAEELQALLPDDVLCRVAEALARVGL